MPESTLTFRSADLTLAGTLTLPGVAQPVPGVVLVTGSGPIDRDGNHKKLPLAVSAQLAAALTAGGVASLRYDKRGVGASEGTFLAAGLDDNVDDAAAAVEALRAQPAVDPDRIVVVGHSEGALIATALAARGVPLAGVVLLAGAARSGEEVLRWQADQLGPTLPAPVRWVLRLMRTDLPTQVRKNHAKIKATTTDVARVGPQRINARWHREFMAYDPAADLGALTASVLALTGAKDLQAPPDDLEVIARLVPGEVQTELVADLSHILRTQDGAPSLKSYRADARRPVDARVLDLVVSWVRRTTAVSEQAPEDAAPGVAGA